MVLNLRSLLLLRVCFFSAASDMPQSVGRLKQKSFSVGCNNLIITTWQTVPTLKLGYINEIA
jgi:hypothetical protein